MGLETGNYIDNLDRDWPLSSDNVSEGDNHLQLIKRALQYTFPLGTDTAATSDVGPDQAVQVLIAKADPGPTIDTSASGHAARAMGMLWLDTTLNLLKIRNQANDAWITLPFDPETSNKVLLGVGGSIEFEGATADAYETTLDVVDPTADRTVSLPNATDTLVGKATTDTLTNKTMTSSGNTFDDATTSAKGMASFSSDNFGVSSGAVTIKDQGVANAELAYMAANTVKVRDANSLGAPSDLALATTQVMIGDGTGFTAAALSGDVTMTNAGVVTVAKITGETVSTTAAAEDQYLKYSASAGEWEKVNVLAPDQLSGTGQLLTYNGGTASDTSWAGGTTTSGDLDASYDDKVLMADSTLLYGMNWKEVDTASIADDAITAAKLADTAVTANTYGYPSEIIVDAQGRLTSATAGTAGATAGFSVAMAIAL